ncbi:MAG: ABC transporter ATP-binding protein [Acidobacteria bacterium]|nr:ABC transporter ATP-binding protein [Acidobacteriota bacterium]
MVEIRGLKKSYPLAAETVEALRGVSLVLRAGEMVALVGSSGSGKTTLLNLLGCLDRPTDGVILLEGQEVQALGEHRLAEVRRRQVGIVFQDAALIPTITALENVGLPFSFDRWSGERAEIPAQMLSLVGLADKGGRYPEELSGGERQRVAIARALVYRPSLLLADEPTGNLDSENGRRIFALFRELVAKHRIAALVATHNKDLAGMADRSVHLRDGRLVDGGDR